jgi:hypothetical protein
MAGVKIDLFVRQPFHCYLCLDQPLASGLSRDCKGNSSEDPVAAPGQKFHAVAKSFLIFDLGKNAPANGNDGVGGKNERVRMFAGNYFSFLSREPQCVAARQFPARNAFVNVSGKHRIGHDSDTG